VAIDHATHALGRNTPATSDRLNHPVRYSSVRGRFRAGVPGTVALLASPPARLRRTSCAVHSYSA
jgi:hypothetical protein